MRILRSTNSQSEFGRCRAATAPRRGEGLSPAPNQSLLSSGRRAVPGALNREPVDRDVRSHAQCAAPRSTEVQIGPQTQRTRE